MFSIKHHRRSIRLNGYDYTQPGAYFVTIDTWQHECLFGEIVDDTMILNEIGEIVREEWLKTADIRHEIQLDVFQIMPNHLHGILCIIEDDHVGTHRIDFGTHDHGDVGAHGRAPLPQNNSQPIRKPRSL